MKLSEEESRLFQEKILTWYTKNKRDLPWREMSKDISLDERAYRILISEVMSQQTQINRVVPKYEAWLKKFPTVKDLASAKVSEVLLYWSGLGYNRRALNLKRTAEIIHRDYKGKFPQEEKLLKLLPGIGEYTARALLCFAFDQQLTVVDTNVRKVMLIEFAITDGEDVKILAEQLLPQGRAYAWNQALMDYASHVLKKEKVPIPKQSKFIGSKRYYRGQILKILLKNKTMKISELGPRVKKDYSLQDEVWLQDLLKELIAEGFVMQKNNVIALVS